PLLADRKLRPPILDEDVRVRHRSSVGTLADECQIGDKHRRFIDLPKDGLDDAWRARHAFGVSVNDKVAFVLRERGLTGNAANCLLQAALKEVSSVNWRAVSLPGEGH